MLRKEIICLLFFFFSLNSFSQNNSIDTTYGSKIEFGFNLGYIFPTKILRSNFSMGIFADINLHKRVSLRITGSLSFYDFTNQSESTMYEAGANLVLTPVNSSQKIKLLIGGDYKKDQLSNIFSGIYLKFGTGYQIKLTHFILTPEFRISMGEFNSYIILISFKG